MCEPLEGMNPRPAHYERKSSLPSFEQLAGSSIAAVHTRPIMSAQALPRLALSLSLSAERGEPKIVVATQFGSRAIRVHTWLSCYDRDVEPVGLLAACQGSSSTTYSPSEITAPYVRLTFLTVRPFPSLTSSTDFLMRP